LGEGNICGEFDACARARHRGDRKETAIEESSLEAAMAALPAEKKKPAKRRNPPNARVI
jgi:hypothetical protein